METVKRRYGMVLRVKPEGEAEYRAHHARVWPPVLEMIRQSNIRNYSIFIKDGMLYSYFEYVGEDFAADMARMAADPATQQWWAVVRPLTEPVPTHKEGEFWADMEEIFHTE
jgi:L-rhamnose mutarotase